MDVVFGAPTVANSTRGLFAERESMFIERQSAFVARENTVTERENTPMSDNLSKRRIHYAKNGRVPKSGVSKHFRCLKEVRLFPKI